MQGATDEELRQIAPLNRGMIPAFRLRPEMTPLQHQWLEAVARSHKFESARLRAIRILAGTEAPTADDLRLPQLVIG